MCSVQGCTTYNPCPACHTPTTCTHCEGTGYVYWDKGANEEVTKEDYEELNEEYKDIRYCKICNGEGIV